MIEPEGNTKKQVTGIFQGTGFFFIGMIFQIRLLVYVGYKKRASMISGRYPRR